MFPGCSFFLGWVCPVLKVRSTQDWKGLCDQVRICEEKSNPGTTGGKGEKNQILSSSKQFVFKQEDEMSFDTHITAEDSLPFSVRTNVLRIPCNFLSACCRPQLLTVSSCCGLLTDDCLKRPRPFLGPRNCSSFRHLHVLTFTHWGQTHVLARFLFFVFSWEVGWSSVTQWVEGCDRKADCLGKRMGKIWSDWKSDNST